MGQLRWLLRPERVIAGLATLAAAVLMARSLPAKSMWIDETLSVSFARQSLGHLFPFFVHREMNMAAYHLALHFWLHLGASETTVRSLSVIFGVAAIPFGYALGARLVSPRAGAIAAILLALNGALYSYAREARSYSLVVLLIVAASYFLVEATATGRRSFWIAYVFTATLAVYAHFFALFVIGAHLLSVLAGPHERHQRRRVVVATAAILVLAIPALVYIARGNTELTTDPNVSIGDVPDLFRFDASGNRALLAVYALATLATAVTALMRVRHGRTRDSWPELFLFTWLIVPIVCALLLSYAIDPMFEPRYLLVSLPPLILLTATGIAAVRPLALLIIAAALAAGASYRSLSLCEPGCATPTQDFRGATAFIRANAEAGDQVVFDPDYLQTAYSYYANPTGIRAVEIPREVSTPGRSAPRIWLLSDLGDPNREKSTSLIRALTLHDRQQISRKFPARLEASLYVQR